MGMTGTDLEEAVAGRHVLVTGANRGIGAAFVDVLLEAGAARVYACARDPRALEAAMVRHGPRLAPLIMDVTEPGDVRRAAALVDRLDLVVSNAGREGSGSVLEMDEARARHLFEVHLWGPWRLAALLAPRLETGGGMVFVQSVAALALSRRGPFYSASKAAATMMASALREALRDRDLVVTNVFPGFTDTGMVADPDIPKAGPREVAERALAGWAAGAESVYPDAFAEMVHRQLRADVDAVIDRPAATVTALYREYLLDGAPPSAPRD